MTKPGENDPQNDQKGRKKARLSGLRHLGAPGSQPGTLESRADPSATRIEVFAYGPDGISEQNVAGAAEIQEIRSSVPVLWINVVGLGDVNLIAQLGEDFGLHRLALEDVVNVHQRPKAEEYDDHIFIIARMLHGDAPADSEQVSMFMGKDYLLTFQEREGDSFEPVRKRLRDGRGRIRSSPPDYLCYALIDALVDGYFPVLEHYGDKLEDIEDEVISDPQPGHVETLHGLKRELLLIRRSVWPLREMINSIIRDEHDLFTEPTRVYLRDVYDHAIQLMDIIETYREIATGLIDVYISSVGARMNEIMKVLTIIATIFIPLGFIAGLYGMNFDTNSPWNLPELGFRYGYPVTLLSMFLIGGGMLYLFWRNGWIGKGPRKKRRARH